ncbi:NAD-dependent epimerase/dehydratase family protein [Rhodobacteraceae bacterium KN286]|uniref:NAD-dependent epimerase/dehydratase family protein n=1 Tax=Oceanomicrobium pacificus TaxID=2692916 RepID=A0A6B0TTR6_9RHOB|nr:NAD-dependent epimerase/dehydratase family protein [Oceanomicrobium pacificus]
MTGSTGRVGRAVVARALRDGHSVTAIDRTAPEASDNPRLHGVQLDCTDYDAFHAALAGHDALIHLAAIPIPGTHPDPVVHNGNVAGSYNALHAALDQGIRRICQASSVNATGLAFSRAPVFDYFPLDEDHPTRAEDAYSLSKWICEQQGDAFARLCPDATIASLRFHYCTPARDGAAGNFLPRDDDAAKHLWGYTLFDDAAAACLAVLDAPYRGHEAFYITGRDTVHDRPSRELAATHFPDVPLRGTFEGRASFFSTAKAERLLGLTLAG